MRASYICWYRFWETIGAGGFCTFWLSTAVFTNTDTSDAYFSLSFYAEFYLIFFFFSYASSLFYLFSSSFCSFFLVEFGGRPLFPMMKFWVRMFSFINRLCWSPFSSILLFSSSSGCCGGSISWFWTGSGFKIYFLFFSSFSSIWSFCWFSPYLFRLKPHVWIFSCSNNWSYNSLWHTK